MFSLFLINRKEQSIFDRHDKGRLGEPRRPRMLFLLLAGETLPRV
jgi:hypothetical protein